METVEAKTILAKKKGTEWFGTDYNMNLYRGCCHGCIYCDSRSDCYRIDRFDTVRAKADAIIKLRMELKSKLSAGVVATGSMSDPYNPFEEKERLTRQALELLDQFGFGVAIATKSPLVTRDTDVLKRIAQHSPVIVKMTITTPDDALARQVEPRVAPSSERFSAIRALRKEGIFAGLLLMPVLPFLEDSEESVQKIVTQAGECGANFIYAAFGMTMRDTQREWYYRQLDLLFPGLKERYDKQYGGEYNCVSPYAPQLWKVFQAECRRWGIRYRMKDIIEAYQKDYRTEQISLWE